MFRKIKNAPRFFQSFELCRRVGFARGTPRRFGCQTFLDRLGADSNVFHLAIDDGLYSLQIGKKPPLGHSRNVRADAAFLFGLAAAPNMISLARPLSSQLTNSRHSRPFSSNKKKILRILAPYCKIFLQFSLHRNAEFSKFRLAKLSATPQNEGLKNSFRQKVCLAKTLRQTKVRE